MMGEKNVPQEEAPSQHSTGSDRLCRDFDMTDHEISLEELCSKLNTDTEFGLSQAAASAHIARDGRNLIVQNQAGLEASRFFRCMLCGVALLLWSTALHCIIVITVLSTVYDELSLSQMYLIFTLVFHALIIGCCLYVQGKGADVSDAIAQIARNKVEVIREGRLSQIPAGDLAVGDLILLRFGEQIPADVRIVKSENFKVDNFAFTGMHDPQPLHEDANETNPLESPNIAFLSGTAVEGSARGIVIRTGARTLVGTIFSARREKEFLCPITTKMVSCLNRSSLVALLLAVLFFLVFWFSADSRRVTDASLVSIIIVVAVIPEDLLPAMLISLKIHCRYMSSKSCNMRRMLALQRLPFVNTICLNKPSIVTLSDVHVSSLWYDKKIVKVRGGTKITLKERTSPTFKELGRCSLLCNEASFKQVEDDGPINQREIVGNSDEAAILKFFVSALGKRVDRIREAHPKVFCLPRKLTSGFQASVHVADEAFLVVLTGEPDYLLEKCSAFAMLGRNVPIDDDFIRDIDKVCVHFASNGDKIVCVIAQAVSTEFDVDSFKIPESGYVLLGMVTLKETPRPNVVQAIEKCREAGIKVILTTNDHPIMAKSFARLTGVISEKHQTLEEKMESKDDDRSRVVNSVVIDGSQLKKLSLDKFQSLTAKYLEVVLARTSPIQKLLLVAMCQQNDSMVAFVGDGVNDAVIMQKADVSIAICDGDCNSPQKAQADVLLTDDSYSFAACIEEGRVIYDNIKKCSAYTLTSNVPAAMSVIAYCVIGVPLPMNPVGLVLTEVLLELFPMVALTFEKSEANVMHQPPRNINGDRLWSRQMIFYACAQIGLIETFACFFTYFVIMQHFGWSPVYLFGIRDQWDSKVVTDLEDSYGQKWTYEARKHLEHLCQTGYFYSLILVQLANVLVCRNQRVSFLKLRDRSWLIQFGLLFEVCIALFFMYLPKVNDVVQMKPLKPIWWLIPIPYLLLIILYDQLKKFIVRRSPKGWLATETLF